MEGSIPESGAQPPTVPRQGGRKPAFARAALQTYATNIAVAVLSLLNVIVIGRALGVDGRGDVTFLTTITLLTASLASLGVHQASANLTATEPERRPALASNALLFSLFLGAIAAGFVAALIVIFPGVGATDLPALRWLALGAIPLMIFRIYIGLLAQADYAFTVSNIAWLIGPLVNVVINGAVALIGTLTVGIAMGTWIGGQALGVSIVTVYVARRLAGFGRPDLGLAWRSVRFGIKAHAGQVMLVGNYRLDQWLLGAMVGVRELGLYSVAVAWAEALFFLPTALAAVLRPDVARDSAAGAGPRSAAVFRVGMVATVPLAVGLVLAAPVLCVTVFGDEFGGAVDDLRWLVPGGFGIVAMKILGSTLTAQGKPMLETAAIAAAFVSTVTLDVILIPRYGGLGAAVASSIAYCIGGVVVGLIFVRALRIRTTDLVPRFGEVKIMAQAFNTLLRRPSVADGERRST